MSSAKIIELNETNTCKICDNALAKYSCPKCNIIYCSLICYQASTHLDCTEDFYKENVMAELNLNKSNPESEKKMFEILQKYHENNRITSPGDYKYWDAADGETELDEDAMGQFSQFVDVEDLEEDLDSDDEDYIDIAERLAGVDLDDTDTVWDKLTNDERQDFMAFLKTEDISKLIPSWTPWWMYTEANKISEVNIDQTDEFKSDCPKLGVIKDFSSITTKNPANCVAYNLVNLLAAYAFTARYFNGEHFDFPNEAVAVIASVSLHLKKELNFEDYDTAVKSVEQECINCEWIITDSENLDLIKEDLNRILNGPTPQEKNKYVLCALTDFQNLLKACENHKEDFAKHFPNHYFPQVQYENKDNIRKYIKKTDYLLAFAKDVFNMAHMKK
ncbi:zinc finger HIT domain-containing protein 2 isoform X2 [Anthonomus grandis grandis]|uniref:zinc finger HIT domain-containing protein 2 isoform X2 n=1 Tax=Anthonomus grandis grandis TaxID=2921223 RepID=UPI0021667B83|nr:zinc finger HIT domain-containing protein 2 isoform X2 [Anthonomus grandis grandis]